MSSLNKSDDIGLTVTNNVISGDVVIGEAIKIDNVKHTITTLGTYATLFDIFNDGSAQAGYLFDGDCVALDGCTEILTPTDVTYIPSTNGQAIVFSGVSHSMAEFGTLKMFGISQTVGTFAAWVLCDSTKDTIAVLGYEELGSVDEEHRIAFNVYSDGRILTRFGGVWSTGANEINSPANAARVDTYVHCVFVGDSSTGYGAAYVNGEYIGTVTNLSLFNSDGPDDFAVLGEVVSFDNSAYHYASTMESVRIFNRIIDADEVAILYNEYSPGVVAGTSPTLPASITEATTEAKTKLVVTDNLLDMTKVIPTDELLIDGNDYVVDSLGPIGIIHDIFGDNSAVATYKLDIDSQDLGGTYNGTDTNIAYVEGHIGSAAYFDATLPSKVTLAIPAPAGGVGTASFWCTKDISSEDSVFVSDDNYILRVTNTNVYVYGSSNFTTFSAARGQFGATFCHAVVMYDGANSARLFVNNTEYARDDANLIGGMRGITRFGEKSNNSLRLTGRIDTVRIFDKELTLEEIDILYNEDPTTTTMTTVPTLPATITDVYKKEMLAVAKVQFPISDVDSILNMRSVSLLPNIITTSDATIITVSELIIDGDEVYVTDLTDIAVVTATSVVDNGDGTFTCDHGQLFTPTYVYIKDNVSVHILDDDGVYNEMSKSIPTVILGDVATYVYDILGDSSTQLLYLLDGDATEFDGGPTLSEVGTVTYTDGVHLNALHANGVGKLEGTISAPVDISISLWFKANLVGDTGDLIYAEDSTSGFSMYLHDSGNTLTCTLRVDTTNTIYRANALTDSTQWNHIVMTTSVSGDTFQTYLNGVYVGATSLGGAGRIVESIGYGIGGRPGLGYFPGDVDHFRVFDRFLTQEDIDIIYAESPFPKLLQENYIDYDLPTPTSTVQHFIRQKYAGTNLSGLQADFSINLISSIDPLGDGSLIAKYELENDAVDTCGTYDGTLVDTTFGAGAFGIGVTPSVDTERVNIPQALLDTQILTVTAFVTVNTLGGNQQMLSNFNSATAWLWLIDPDGYLKFYSSNSNLYSGTILLTAGNSYFITATFDSSAGTISFTVDGVDSGSATPGTIARSLATSPSITAGYVDSPDQVTMMDQVEFYNRSLTIEEIQILNTQRRIL